MKYEYASVRYTLEEHTNNNKPILYIKTPLEQYSGTLDQLFDQLKLGGNPSIAGIFTFLGMQGWRLHTLSRDNMYFFEREVE